MQLQGLMSVSEKFSGTIADADRYRLLIEGITGLRHLHARSFWRRHQLEPGAQRFMGYSRDEIIGEHFSRFYTPEDIAAGVPERALELARTKGKFEAEGWRIAQGRHLVFWAYVVIDPIRDGSDSIIGFAKVTRDLTRAESSRRSA